MNKELVIAAYDEELDWINLIKEDTKISIYRKGDKIKLTDKEIKLEPNKGRCVHTFFNHIYKNYNNLSDITFFVQDYPFDHWENLIEVINNNTWESNYTIKIDGYYGFHYNNIGKPDFKFTYPLKKGGGMWSMTPSLQHGNGNVLTCYSNGLPQDKVLNLNVDSYWVKIFTNKTPNQYEFIPGGHFGITKETVLIRSKDFYGKIVELLETDNISPWIIERLECYIFNKKYITKIL